MASVDTSPARDAFVPGTSPTAREVAGAYDAARFGFEPLRDGAAKAPTPRSGGRGAARTTLPTNRVGALVRAFGAHVRATETDILKKCERLVDPTSVGFFELSKARLGVVLSMERFARKTERARARK